MDRVGKELGRPYYKIPCGGSNALGALGYVECAREIRDQGIPVDHLICAEGSGGTMAGLALGAKLYLPGTKVYGMMVDTDPFDQITPALMREAAALLEADVTVDASDFTLRDMCGPGYAIASKAGNDAVALMARQEGIFLDPVYTGKAFAGLLAMAEEGRFGSAENVLFLLVLQGGSVKGDGESPFTYNPCKNGNFFGSSHFCRSSCRHFVDSLRCRCSLIGTCDFAWLFILRQFFFRSHALAPQGVRMVE